MSKVYITTAIPYVNGAPHIGHAMDYCLADVCARYQRMVGNEVRLQAGTDDHGGKVDLKARELGVSAMEYADENSQKFRDFIGKLGVEYTDFIRTTDAEHVRLVQEIWRKLAPHIYLASYEGWYCTGCERFVTSKEYEENGGICPEHKKSYEKIVDENYFLRIDDFRERIRQAIESDEMVIKPEFRKREVLKLLDDAPDVSISRSREQLSWGVPVPEDDSQVMYVWIDALANYITVLGCPEKQADGWWPAFAQFVGKDILRFHAIIWPAMLLGLGLPLPKNLISHGHVLADGQKMSKSVGNVVDPIEVIERHGVSAFRYFFLRHVDTFADSDFTWQKFESAYNDELANDLGNLVQRLATLASKAGHRVAPVQGKLAPEYCELMESFEFSRAIDYVWSRIEGLNRRIDLEKPWSLGKSGKKEELSTCLDSLIGELLTVNNMLRPFLPETASRIAEIFCGLVEPPSVPLFPKESNQKK